MSNIICPPEPPDWMWWGSHMRAVWRGVEPAEALATRDREHVVASLHAFGATDRQVAALTRMTTYTAGRIRSRLGLPFHEQLPDASDLFEQRWRDYEEEQSAAALAEARTTAEARVAAVVDLANMHAAAARQQARGVA